MDIIATYYLEADDVEAAADALDATLSGVPIEEHIELKAAIEQGGLP